MDSLNAMLFVSGPLAYMLSYFLHTSQLATQTLLRKLLTEDLPGLMVLPKRIEIAIPPSVTSVAEAAVGRDTIMRAVASAVLQVRDHGSKVLGKVVQDRTQLKGNFSRRDSGGARHDHACGGQYSAAGEEGKWCTGREMAGT